MKYILNKIIIFSSSKGKKELPSHHVNKLSKFSPTLATSLIVFCSKLIYSALIHHSIFEFLFHKDLAHGCIGIVQLGRDIVIKDHAKNRRIPVEV